MESHDLIDTILRSLLTSVIMEIVANKTTALQIEAKIGFFYVSSSPPSNGHISYNIIGLPGLLISEENNNEINFKMLAFISTATLANPDGNLFV